MVCACAEMPAGAYQTELAVASFLFYPLFLCVCLQPMNHNNTSTNNSIMILRTRTLGPVCDPNDPSSFEIH